MFKGFFYFFIISILFWIPSSYPETGREIASKVGHFCFENFQTYEKNSSDQSFTEYSAPSGPIPENPPEDPRFTQCVCDRMKQLKNIRNISQLSQYCIAWEEYDTASIVQPILLSLDSATALACSLNCAFPELPLAAQTCNCLGLVSQGVGFAFELEALAIRHRFGPLQTSEVVLGPILHGGGVIGNGIGCAENAYKFLKKK